mmetsp:Transcript_3415/g.3734  ORF Transcript_3415/g.3734 Transcript_3415/m.3734 type:complete len:134 (+) Transcript_3415:77-478(+)
MEAQSHIQNSAAVSKDDQVDRRLGEEYEDEEEYEVVYENQPGFWNKLKRAAYTVRDEIFFFSEVVTESFGLTRTEMDRVKTEYEYDQAEYKRQAELKRKRKEYEERIQRENEEKKIEEERKKRAAEENKVLQI